MTASFRRRADNVALRWQARLDSDWSDRVAPWLVAAGLFVLLAALSLAKARSLEGSTDLAVYTQAAWLIREGHAPVLTITNDAHLLAQQAAFLFYPMSAVSYVLPIIPGLLVLQAAVLALAVPPLWRIARGLAHLRVGATAALVTVYGFYAVMHNLNLDGFHPEVIAVPGLLAAFYFGWTERWKLFALCCAVVVLSRADLGLAVAGLGLLLVVDGKRRAGAITAVLAMAWTFVCVVWVQPAFGDGATPHLAAFAEFGSSPLAVAGGLLTQPIDVLGNVFAEQNFLLFVTLLAPVVFLPLLVPRFLLVVLPLELLYLVADVPQEAVFGQQTVAITAFVFIATAFALNRIGRKGVDKVTVDPRLLGVLVLSGLVFFIAFSASSPYRQPWDWGGQDAVDDARLAASDVVPDDAAVRASSSMLQELAERTTIYALDTDEAPDATVAIRDVDVVVLDGNDESRWDEAAYQQLAASIEAHRFRVVYSARGVVVLTRT